jgi:osmotically-inducible protein OsmY
MRAPNKKEFRMSWDTDLTAYVSDELLWDPRIENVAIAVSAKDGNITLRGTVGSPLEKRRAYKAALRVSSAISVDNQLQVRLLTELRRIDADIRGVVLQALMLDSLVPKTVDASVRNGYVTLKGTVRWQYERDEAGFVASSIVGALDVSNEIEIKHPAPNAGDAENSIKNTSSATRASMPTRSPS